jgi:hypothetical protein
MVRIWIHRVLMVAGAVMSLGLALIPFEGSASANTYRGCYSGTACSQHGQGGVCNFINDGDTGYCACTVNGSNIGTNDCKAPPAP